MFEVLLPILPGATLFVGLVLGHWFGRRVTLREHRRTIEAGREYIEALDQATAQCMPGHSLSVSLVVEKPAQPRATGKVHLRAVGKPK